MGAELQQVRWGQFLRDDNGARRYVELPGFPQQHPQDPLAQVVQIIGALGQQRALQLPQHLALLVDGAAPSVGRGATLFDRQVGGVQQDRIFQQCQVGAEDRLLIDVAPGLGVVQGQLDLATDLRQGIAKPLPLFCDVVTPDILGQLNAFQVNQRSTDQAGRGAYAVQHTVFGATAGRLGRRCLGMGLFGQGCG